MDHFYVPHISHSFLFRDTSCHSSCPSSQNASITLRSPGPDWWPLAKSHIIRVHRLSLVCTRSCSIPVAVANVGVTRHSQKGLVGFSLPINSKRSDGAQRLDPCRTPTSLSATASQHQDFQRDNRTHTKNTYLGTNYNYIYIFESFFLVFIFILF